MVTSWRAARRRASSRVTISIDPAGGSTANPGWLTKATFIRPASGQRSDRRVAERRVHLVGEKDGGAGALAGHAGPVRDVVLQIPGRGVRLAGAPYAPAVASRSRREAVLLAEAHHVAHVGCQRQVLGGERRVVDRAGAVTELQLEADAVGLLGVEAQAAARMAVARLTPGVVALPSGGEADRGALRRRRVERVDGERGGHVVVRPARVAEDQRPVEAGRQRPHAVALV